MKKNYIILLVGLFTITTFSQSIFNNGMDQTGDSNWFTATNWNTDVVPDASVGYLQINQDVTLNAPVIHKWVRGGNGTVTISGSGVITISDTNTDISGGIQANSTSFNLNLPIVFDSDGIKNIFIGANNREIIFNSSVICNTTASVVAADPSRFVQFNEVQSGDGLLRFTSNSGGEFSATSNNAGLINGLQVADGCNVISNSAAVGSFIGNNGGVSKFQVNGTGSTLTLNGSDTFQGYISIGGETENYSFTLNVNADQPNIESIRFINPASTGTLSINIDSAITNLSFGDCSTYNIPGINISGFEAGEIRFGLDNTGLTAGQLANITADGVAAGQALGLDANGYLVLASTLEIDDKTKKQEKRISYPTIVDNEIRFTSPQRNFKVFDIAGKIILSNDKRDVQSLNLSSIKSGLYIMKFENNQIEKIIKK